MSNGDDDDGDPIVFRPISLLETKILAECKVEAFAYRGLPVASTLGMVTYLGVRKGYLKPNKRFGPVPKVLMALVAGFWIGKLSYNQTCYDKFLRKAPHGVVADEVSQAEFSISNFNFSLHFSLNFELV